MPQTGDRKDPLIAFRYRITITGLAVGGFSECSGLQLETEPFEYAEGGRNAYMRKFPTRTKQSNIILKRGIVDRALWDWYWDVTQGKITRRGGTIEIQDLGGSEALMSWEFSRAFPIKWIGPALNATQNSVAIETFELVHEGLELER